MSIMPNFKHYKYILFLPDFFNLFVLKSKNFPSILLGIYSIIGILKERRTKANALLTIDDEYCLVKPAT